MKRFLPAHCAPLIFAWVLAGFVGSAVWTAHMRQEVRRVRTQTVAMALTGPTYVPVPLMLPEVTRRAWQGSPQPVGDEGSHYDLFTPPVIVYDQRTASFTIGRGGPPMKESPAFNLGLKEVKPDLYRWQLAGWVNGKQGAAAVFEQRNGSRAVIAQVGQHSDELGATLKRFVTERILVKHDDARPVYEVAGVADVIEDETGATVSLNTRSRKFTGTWVAVLAWPDQTRELKECREGDDFQDGDFTYHVGPVARTEAVISRRRRGSNTDETMTLQRPAEKINQQVAGFSSLSGRNSTRAFQELARDEN